MSSSSLSITNTTAATATIAYGSSPRALLSSQLSTLDVESQLHCFLKEFPKARKLFPFDVYSEPESKSSPYHAHRAKWMNVARLHRTTYIYFLLGTYIAATDMGMIVRAVAPEPEGVALTVALDTATPIVLAADVFACDSEGLAILF